VARPAGVADTKAPGSLNTAAPRACALEPAVAPPREPLPCAQRPPSPGPAASPSRPAARAHVVLERVAAPRAAVALGVGPATLPPLLLCGIGCGTVALLAVAVADAVEDDRSLRLEDSCPEQPIRVLRRPPWKT